MVWFVITAFRNVFFAKDISFFFSCLVFELYTLCGLLLKWFAHVAHALLHLEVKTQASFNFFDRLASHWGSWVIAGTSSDVQGVNLLYIRRLMGCKVCSMAFFRLTSDTQRWRQNWPTYIIVLGVIVITLGHKTFVSSHRSGNLLW